MSEARRMATEAVSEADFQQKVFEAARLFGWRYVHFRPARTLHGWTTAQTGDKGFPDAVLVRGERGGRIGTKGYRRPRLLFIEFKREKGKPSEEQLAWIDALNEVDGVTAMVARPSQFDQVLEALR